MKTRPTLDMILKTLGDLNKRSYVSKYWSIQMYSDGSGWIINPYDGREDFSSPAEALAKLKRAKR